MWEKIIIGIIVAVAVFYIGRRIFMSVKGKGEGCADCSPGEIRKQIQK